MVYKEHMVSPSHLFLRLFVITLLIAVISSTGIAREAFFPSRDGLTWRYSNGETQTLTGPYEVDDFEVMVLTHYNREEPISEDYLIYLESGVYSLGTTTTDGQQVRYDPPLVIYEGDSLHVGQMWNSTTTVEDMEITLQSEVVGVRGVKTEAGRFNSLLIRQTTLTSTGAQTLLDLYFVPSIGVVRFAHNDGTVVDLIDKSF